MDDDPRVALARLVREEGPRVVATLIRLTGDVQIAEEAVQEAAIKALKAWPDAGIPDNPRAWLTVAARHCALDTVRRESHRDHKEAEALRLQRLFAAEPVDSDVPDDLLRLVFTCCHPALALESQLALSLRTLCGLSTAEVARALLVPEPTMLRRLTRAKQKIARAGIPFRIPAAAELPERVAGVVGCVYLLFNEGYAATAGDDPIRPELVDEAIRLARLLNQLLPGQPALVGALALMLLHDSRRAARISADTRSCCSPIRIGHGGGPSRSERGSNCWARASPAVPTGRIPTLSRRPSRPATRWRRATRTRTGRPSCPGTTCY